MELSIEQITQNYSSSLFKVCLGYSKTREEAEDLLQDVLVNIWKGLPSFRQESNIKTWIYRIAINTCLLNKRSKTIETVPLHTINIDTVRTEVENENFNLLHNSILELLPKDKAIILLYLDRFTHQEISSIIGITSNYVGVKISRIKQQLINKVKANG